MATIITGAFIIVPVGILFIIMGKVFLVLKKALTALHINFDKSTPFADLLNTLLIIFFILLLCLLCGSFATPKGKGKFIDTGELFIVNSDDVVKTDITHAQALQLMPSMGEGAWALLHKHFEKDFPRQKRKTE